MRTIALSRVSLDAHATRSAGVHVNGLPATIRLVARVARGSRLPGHATMKRVEGPVQSSESANQHSPVQRPLNVRKVLANLGERPTLLCKRDALLVPLPSCVFRSSSAAL